MVTRSGPRLPTVTSCSMDMNTILTYLEQQGLPRHSLEIANHESRITNLEGLVITNSLATNGKAGKAVEEGNQIVNN